MSSIGILFLIVAVFVILNADKLAWVLMGHYRLNTKGFERPNERE